MSDVDKETASDACLVSLQFGQAAGRVEN
jgi:hypothetical protein